MSQCAAAILQTRVGGAISAGARRGRGPWARKYVSIKAKGRKPTGRKSQRRLAGFPCSESRGLPQGLAETGFVEGQTMTIEYR
jgi:hypothetical protein